jgi:hypothetical protein
MPWVGIFFKVYYLVYRFFPSRDRGELGLFSRARQPNHRSPSALISVCQSTTDWKRSINTRLKLRVSDGIFLFDADRSVHLGLLPLAQSNSGLCILQVVVNYRGAGGFDGWMVATH